MKNYLFLIFLGLATYSHHGVDKKVSIYLEEYNYYFTPQKTNCTDTLEEKLNDDRTLKIKLFNCQGQMHLKCYKKNLLIEEGDYINSLDLLKKYTNSGNAITGKVRIEVREYYQPLRSGNWFFYNNRGDVIQRKLYVDGLLVKD